VAFVPCRENKIIIIRLCVLPNYFGLSPAFHAVAYKNPLLKCFDVISGGQRHDLKIADEGGKTCARMQVTQCSQIGLWKTKVPIYSFFPVQGIALAYLPTNPIPGPY